MNRIKSTLIRFGIRTVKVKLTFAPDMTELKELAAVARLRWTIEECFQSAKGETGSIIVKRVVGTLGTVT